MRPQKGRSHGAAWTESFCSWATQTRRLGALIMIIDRELRECFGEELIFASDEDRAFDWLISLRRRRIGWKQARAQIVEYLRSHHATKIHIRKQVDRARPMLTKWLHD